MRRLCVAVLCSSLPFAVLTTAQASPGRTLQYSVVATSAGIARHATVTVDFLGGSAERVMNVDVDEVAETGEQLGADVGIEPSGSLRSRTAQSLTSEEEAICSLMALESEDMAGVGKGDHWERQGPVPGGRQHTRFTVLGVSDAGLVELGIARDTLRDDGSLARWSGTMFYDAEAFVPSIITLTGNLNSDDDERIGGRSVALTIRLIHDTFKHY